MKNNGTATIPVGFHFPHPNVPKMVYVDTMTKLINARVVYQKGTIREHLSRDGWRGTITKVSIFFDADRPRPRITVLWDCGVNQEYRDLALSNVDCRETDLNAGVNRDDYIYVTSHNLPGVEYEKEFETWCPTGGIKIDADAIEFSGRFQINLGPRFYVVAEGEDDPENPRVIYGEDNALRTASRLAREHENGAKVMVYKAYKLFEAEERPVKETDL